MGGSNGAANFLTFVIAWDSNYHNGQIKLCNRNVDFLTWVEGWDSNHRMSGSDNALQVSPF
jgi:hypothetical protein